MKHSGILYCRVMICAVFTLPLCGCISVSNTPAPRFYMLSGVDNNQVSQKFAIPQDVIIAVGPVKIPDYQNRPQIVTQNKNKMLTFAQFDRWGEPLDMGLARSILENLTLMLPEASLGIFPCNFAIPVKYQVIADVIQLESDLNGDMFLVVRWSVINAKNNTMLITKRSEFRQAINPHSYSGLTVALSKACVLLSNEIAESLAALVKQPETTNAQSR